MGGAGLVFSEMTCVSRDGRITPGCAGLYRPEHVAAWKRVIDYVHNSLMPVFVCRLGTQGEKVPRGLVGEEWISRSKTGIGRDCAVAHTIL